MLADLPDPILGSVDALRSAGVGAKPERDDPVRWQIGGIVLTGADVLRLAGSQGLIGG